MDNMTLRLIGTDWLAEILRYDSVNELDLSATHFLRRRNRVIFHIFLTSEFSELAIWLLFNRSCCWKGRRRVLSTLPGSWSWWRTKLATTPPPPWPRRWATGAIMGQLGRNVRLWRGDDIQGVPKKRPMFKKFLASSKIALGIKVGSGSPLSYRHRNLSNLTSRG